MKKARLNKISEIKSLDDLKSFKMKRKYELELKKLEAHSSLILVQMNLQPDSIKETIMTEARWYSQDLLMKYVPSFVLNMFANKMR